MSFVFDFSQKNFSCRNRFYGPHWDAVDVHTVYVTSNVLSRHLLRGGISPQSVEFPPNDLLSAVKTITFDFLTVNLVLYTKRIIQHHQMHNNWLKIEWDKNFSIFCDPQLTISWVKNSGKPLGSRCSAQTPIGSSQRSPDLLAGGDGTCCPSTITSPLLSLLENNLLRLYKIYAFIQLKRCVHKLSKSDKVDLNKSSLKFF